MELTSFFTVEHFVEYFDLYIVAMLGISAIPGILIAKNPLSRPKYVRAMIIAPVVDFVIVLVAVFVITTFQDPILPIAGAIFGAVGIIAVNFWFMCQHARRFIDIGWSKWWFLICLTGVGWWVVSFLPLFYKTRKAVAT